MPEVRFENFPRGEDLWWLRWFDYDGSRSGAAGSAAIRATFSKLERRVREDALPVLDARLAASRTEQCSARLQAGWLPVLSIGLVVRDGMVVGQLGATLSRFAFPARTHHEHLERLIASPPTISAGARARPRPTPSTAIPEGTMPGLLGALAYPLWGVEDGRLLSIRGMRPGGGHLVLPCPEVLRTMYAPHRVVNQRGRVSRLKG